MLVPGTAAGRGAIVMPGRAGGGAAPGRNPGISEGRMPAGAPAAAGTTAGRLGIDIGDAGGGVFSTARPPAAESIEISP